MKSLFRAISQGEPHTAAYQQRRKPSALYSLHERIGVHPAH